MKTNRNIDLFSTTIYQKNLGSVHQKIKNDLRQEVQVLRRDDKSGREWSKLNYPNGYTSYASANRMHITSPTFAILERSIRTHVIRYIQKLELNMDIKSLNMNTCWVNVMEMGCTHPMHIHPHSVISGTYYVDVPNGSSSIRFEDPRYGLFMSRPPLKKSVQEQQSTHFSVSAKAGDLVLFESWLRHDVPPHSVKQSRMSISFNY